MSQRQGRRNQLEREFFLISRILLPEVPEATLKAISRGAAKFQAECERDWNKEVPPESQIWNEFKAGHWFDTSDSDWPKELPFLRNEEWVAASRFRQGRMV